MERNSRNTRSTRDTSREAQDEDRGSHRSSRNESTGRGSSRGVQRGFEYHKPTAESVKKRAEQRGGNEFDSIFKNGVKVFKVNDDSNLIRILPPTWEDPKHFGFDIFVHYGVGPDNQAYLCRKEMLGEPCPICEERQRAVKDNDDDYAKELRASKRVVYYLIDRDAEKEGVQLWATPWTVDRDINTLIVEPRTGEVLAIDSPENGFDVEFKKIGKGKTTKYFGMQIARRESDLGDDRWLQYAIDNPVPEQLAYFDYDHITSIFGGKTSKKSDDDLDQEQESGLRHVEDRSTRESKRKPDLSFEDVHEMTYEELCAVIDEEKLKIEPEDSKNDEQLADWVCEDLNLEKAKSTGRGRDREADTGEPENARDRLRSMRRGE